jgi:UDP-N-acetylglucosamine 2-epimerase (non-hydrolysing)
LSSALAATKLKIPIIHVESGLRSYDWNMQEEYNRKITDCISDVLFAPTSESALTLEREQLQGAIFTVGNTVIDSIRLCMEMGPDKQLLSGKQGYFDNKILSNNLNDYVLLTLHREENVNDPIKLKRIFDVLSEFDIHCVFPIHPHTLKNLHKFGINYVGKNIEVIDPAGYLDFLKLMKSSKFVITDSGGIQEEITSPYINKRALVLRNSTERYESVSSGHAILCNVEYQEMKGAISSILDSPLITQLRHSISPYGDGHAAEKIVKILKEETIVPLPNRELTKKLGKTMPNLSK